MIEFVSRKVNCLNHGFKGFKEYTGAGYRIEAL
jgi:hypothetical protein